MTHWLFFIVVDSRPYVLITDHCKNTDQERKSKAVLCWIVGVELQIHTFIGFGRVRM